mgnify:CR=1 FL=1
MGALDWMAWTTPTALFFCGIGVALLVLTIWELRSPTVPRTGFLPIETTRGDRFFISLLSAAFLHILIVGLTDLPVWWMSVACILSTLVIMRWG